MASTSVLSEQSIRFIDEVIVDIGASNVARTGCRTVPACSFNYYGSLEEFEHWVLLQSSEHEGNSAHGDTILVVARRYVKDLAETKDAWDPEHDWDAALRDMGLKKETRDGIMTLEFRDLRLTASASEWAIDTVELGFEFLEGLERETSEEEKGWIDRACQVYGTDTPYSELVQRIRGHGHYA
ncbi:hypothetical protein H2199_005223 [Coniosporium tulheliwenetii]|uniref:Uncharacterized protein n=1 Tax=Coniosporium tulheliwenetii TaxID=3383036 RepID=A0ACC2Z395_9PEZI|nr:hypothetical protein H2199_005223 [Cladosporium sp. JES 115]